MYRRLFLILVALFTLYSDVVVFAQAVQDAKECNRLAEIAIRVGNHAEALELLKRARQLDPNAAESYFNVALLARIQNKPDEMTRALKKAVSLEPANPKYVDAYVKILKSSLVMAQKTANTAKVSELQEEILQVNPGEIEIAAEIVQELFQKKKFAEAQQRAEKVLEANKAELARYRNAALGEIYYVLARIQYDGQKIDEARLSADRATRYPIQSPDKAKTLLAEIKQTQKDQVEGLIKIAKSYLARGDKDAALAEFKKALVIDPNSETVQGEMAGMKAKDDAAQLFSQARNHISGDKWLEARDLLEQVLATDPEHKQAKELLKQAIKFETELMKKLGQTERLPRSSEQRAAMLENMINMGTRFAFAGNNKEAELAFSKALALIDLDAKLEKYRASINAEQGKIDSIRHQAELWEKGVDARNNGEYEDCIKLLSQLSPEYNIQLLSYLAEAHWRTGNKEKARECASLQLAKQPDNNRAKFVLGNLLFESEQMAAAYQIFKEINDVDPEYPGLQDVFLQTTTFHWVPYVVPIIIVIVLVWLGYAIYNNLPEYNKSAALKRARKFLQSGMNKECISELDAIKRLPNLTQYDAALIARLMAQAYLKTGRYDRAIGECKHLIALNPKDEEAHTWLGFAYLGRRILSPESLPELMNLYQKEGKNVALVALLGEHFAAAKNLTPEGIAILEQWTALEPGNPTALRPLGQWYLKKNKSDEQAMRVFTSMMETGKAEPEFMLGVAKLHLRQANFDEALKLCETVLTVDVNNELVHSVLRDAYAKMEKLPELIEIYRAYLAENPYNVAFQNGLKETLKILERSGQGVASGAPEELASLVADDSTPGTVACPHCGQANSYTDYYCQACGQSIA